MPYEQPTSEKIANSMKQTTKKEFFDSIGRMDVHPTVRVSTFKEREHVSDWKTRDGHVVGVSVSDSYCVNPTKFYVHGKGAL